MRRGFRSVAVALSFIIVAACTPASGQNLPVVEKYGKHVIHPKGIGTVQFGDPRETLLKSKEIEHGQISCGGTSALELPAFPDETDLVFDEHDRLALVWVYSSAIETPGKLRIGDTVGDMLRLWPSAENLKATEFSHPGLLVTQGETGILFLYEAKTSTIVKLIAGYTHRLRAAQREGLTC